ncbi:MAG: hypothetical protein OEZ52_11025 [Candidatus Aminicenantes bacterium]|nr:hypothetical protein [Candidatus Aminicenantes bacterium]MDH5744069.1 hypothetical protein [Candidatus Aminicenantes bacterium]
MEYVKELRKAYQISFVLHVAFMATLIIYAFTVEILRGNLQDFQGFAQNANFSWIRYIFYGMVLAQVFIIRFIRNILSKRMTSGEERILIGHLNRASVISSALCEVPAVLGVVLFFIIGTARDFYVLLFVSLVLFVLYFPRYANWEEWIKTKARH